MEDEIAGLETRIVNITKGIEELTLLTKQAKEEIEQSRGMIKKYEEQQRNVRNNREFDSISKEMEYQELQIQLSENHLKEYAAEVKVKKKMAEDAGEVAAERRIDLEHKRAELDSIEEETAREIEVLRTQEQAASTKIDERLLDAYRRIRANVRNGLAVVTIKRDACGGCYNRIPPQRQFEIRQGRKIIVCEYCGRILVADPEQEA